MAFPCDPAPRVTERSRTAKGWSSLDPRDSSETHTYETVTTAKGGRDVVPLTLTGHLERTSSAEGIGGTRVLWGRDSSENTHGLESGRGDPQDEECSTFVGTDQDAATLKLRVRRLYCCRPVKPDHFR